MSEQPTIVILTADTILTLDEAIARVTGRASLVRAWLLPLVLPNHPTGKRMVLWGDVINKLRSTPIEEHQPPRRPSKLPRKEL